MRTIRVARCALFAGLLLQGISGAALGATCTSAATGNWNVGATWAAGCGASGPVAGDTVNIGTTAAHTVTIPAGFSAAAASVTIGNTATNGAAALTLGAATASLSVSGAVTVNRANNNNTTNSLNVNAGTASMASLTINGGAGVRLAQIAISTGTATVTGNVTIGGTTANARITFSDAGTLNIGGGLGNGGGLTASTGTVVYNGAGAQNVGTYTYNNLTINKSSGTATLTGNTPVAGNLTVSAGTLDLSTFTANRTAAGGTITVASGATLKIGGTNSFPANYTTHTLGATSTVEYSGTGQTVAAEAAPGYGHLTLSGSGTKTAAGSFTVRGNLAITGVTFAGATFTHTVNGNVSNPGTHTATTGRITLSGGVAAHVLSGTGTYANLELNDANGATLSASPTASGTLTLTSGVVTTGANTLITTANCPGSVSRTGGHVAGFLRLRVPTGSPSCTFDVGDSTTYRPVNLTFSSVTASGDLTGSVSQNAGDHPNIATSGLDSTQSVNRYWTLTNSGVVLSSYSATFNFVSGDVDTGADPLQFEIERWDGAAWNTTTVGTRTATSTQATGITAFSAFASGKKKVVVPTPGSFNAFETSTAAGAITGMIRTKVAGSAFSLDVVAIESGAQQAGFTDAVIVELLGNNTLGVSLDAQNCPTSFTLVQTVSPNPTITGGRSTVSFAAVADSWRDVRVRVRWPTTSPTVTWCSTDNFAIRPSGITVTVTDATWTTPGGIRTLNNTAVSGGTVHRAGQPFRVTASALPGTATQYDGSPTVKTATCLLLGTMTACANGTFTLPGGAWSGAGTRTNDSATYNEVGALTLELEDQSFASVDAADSTLAERTVPQVGGTIQVGRFVPDHFIVAPDGGAPAPAFQTFGAACAATRSFTYIGQPFGFMVPPQALVTARNAAGGTTTNYRESLWKISTAAPSDVTQTYSNNAVGPAIDTSLATNAPTVAPLNDGTGTVTVSLLDRIFYTRSLTTPVAPFNANISLTITVRDDSEADGQITTTTATPFSTIAFDSGNEFRYGRLRLGNANGSQLVPLPVRMEAQYWGFTNPPTNTVLGFITNTADHCTTLTGTNLTMGNFQGNLGPLASCKTNMNANITFTAGRGNLQLTAPGSANNGSVDLTVQLGTGAFGSNSCVTPGSPPPQATTGASRAYLQGNWTGVNFDQNPTGRASFGLYKGAEEVIFIRENF